MTFYQKTFKHQLTNIGVNLIVIEGIIRIIIVVIIVVIAGVVIIFILVDLSLLGNVVRVG